MKKINKKSKVDPLDALNFLESMRTLQSNLDAPRKLISIRVPENILNALKQKAKIENKNYQSLMIQILREHLKM